MLVTLDNPSDVIKTLNTRHRHGDILNCPSCRPLLVEGLAASGGYEVEDDGINQDMVIKPKRKR